LPEFQAGNTPEITKVVRDEGEAVGDGRAADPEILRTDDDAFRVEAGSLHRVCMIYMRA